MTCDAFRKCEVVPEVDVGATTYSLIINSRTQLMNIEVLGEVVERKTQNHCQSFIFDNSLSTCSCLMIDLCVVSNLF